MWKNWYNIQAGTISVDWYIIQVRIGGNGCGMIGKIRKKFFEKILDKLEGMIYNNGVTTNKFNT